MSNVSISCSEKAPRSAQVPWATFLFLLVVFFVAQHNIYISLQKDIKFQPPAESSAIKTVEGSLERRIVFFMLGLYGTICLMCKPRNVFKIIGYLAWFILFFLAWTFLSITWAEDIALTFRKLMLFLMFSLGALAVSKRFSLQDIIWFTFSSTSLYLIIGLSAELSLGTFHPFVSDYRFTGTLHPNQQGLNCAMLLLSAVAAYQNTKRGRKFIFACALIGFIFLILTKSRTPFACIMVSLFVYWSFVLSRYRKIALIISLVFTFSLFILIIDAEPFFSFLQRGALLGRVDATETSTLTGRIPLWKECLEYVARHPLLGYGYGGFWSPRRILDISAEISAEYDWGWGISGACSAYIELLLRLGVVGGFAYVLILITGIKRSFVNYKAFHNCAFLFFGGLLIFCLLDGLLESCFVEPGFLTFLMWVALINLGFQRPYLANLLQTPQQENIPDSLRKY